MNNRNDLGDAIMTKVFASSHQQKASKRKVKAIIFIYLGAIFSVLLWLYLLKGLHFVSPELAMPTLQEIKPGTEDLIIYYKLFTVILVCSLISFGAYFVGRPFKSKAISA